MASSALQDEHFPASRPISTAPSRRSSTSARSSSAFLRRRTPFAGRAARSWSRATSTSWPWRPQASRRGSAPWGRTWRPARSDSLPRRPGRLVVVFDSDPPGREAVRRALPLRFSRSGLIVRSVELADGHDPASLREQAGDEALVVSLGSAQDALGSELARLAAAVPPATPWLMPRRSPHLSSSWSSCQNPRYA